MTPLEFELIPLQQEIAVLQQSLMQTLAHINQDHQVMELQERVSYILLTELASKTGETYEEVAKRVMDTVNVGMEIDGVLDNPEIFAEFGKGLSGYEG